jgi:hypothetical protein
VSADGAGAAVTSMGVSLFCAAAGAPQASSSAAEAPLNALTIMRRTAVILPRPVGCWIDRARLPRDGRVRPLLARKSRQHKALPS